jgi:hypothetical protein
MNPIDNKSVIICLIITKSTHHPTNKKAPVRRLFEPEAFHLIGNNVNIVSELGMLRIFST